MTGLTSMSAALRNAVRFLLPGLAPLAEGTPRPSSARVDLDPERRTLINAQHLPPVRRPRATTAAALTPGPSLLYGRCNRSQQSISLEAL